MTTGSDNRVLCRLTMNHQSDREERKIQAERATRWGDWRQQKGGRWRDVGTERRRDKDSDQAGLEKTQRKAELMDRGINEWKNG